MNANGDAGRRRISIRMGDQLHEDASALADLMGISLNQLVIDALDAHIQTQLAKPTFLDDTERKLKALRAAAKRRQGTS